MSDSDTSGEVGDATHGTESDEIRTLGFRLREIQRLLAARVEQENRRLEAEGIEPVDESRFVATEDGEER